MCSKCGKIHKMNLKDREYICECGNDIDRDLNSAINILKIGREQIELTPVEKSFESSKKQEDAESLAQRQFTTSSIYSIKILKKQFNCAN